MPERPKTVVVRKLPERKCIVCEAPATHIVSYTYPGDSRQLTHRVADSNRVIKLPTASNYACDCHIAAVVIQQTDFIVGTAQSFAGKAEQ